MSKHICMLAHPYDPKRVIFPAYIQPKLNGVRAIWKHKEKQFVSRQNKPLILPQELISRVIGNSIDLDGELTIPGKPFNEVSGIVRHLDLIPEKDTLVYTVFDVIHDFLSYTKRYELLHLLPVCWGVNLVKIPTIEVREFKYIDYFHQKHLDDKYEGSIVRNNAPYEFKRSFNLLKIKPRQRITCKVIGLLEGTGKYEGVLGALTVRTKEEKVFNVGTGFNDEDRTCIWLKDVKYYENKFIVVEFRDYSEFGIPLEVSFKGFKE